jgi:hypothetical protein
MAEIDPISCEPLRVWSRLEPRARQVGFDRVLQARVHDPLWMLARQWQFGEFKGEDTGSAVIARLARSATRLEEVRTGAGATPYDDALPLEARVERLPIAFPPAAAAMAGRLLPRMIAARATELPADAAPLPPDAYRDLLRRCFPLTADEPDPADPAAATAVARQRSMGPAHRMRLALAGRAIDGLAAVRGLPAEPVAADLPSELAGGLDPGHRGIVLAALVDLRDRLARLYEGPADEADVAWDPAALEYRFACTVPRDGGERMVISAEEYASGRLDWYSFDQGPLESAPGATAGADEVVSVIPSPATFAGMPSPRWWEMEDAAVDLGFVTADATDVAKVVVAEFALLFGNNWFIVPYRQDVGTLAEIQGIVVTDVFGRRTLVGAATGSSGGAWNRWDLFSLSPRGTVEAAPPLGQHLLLAPALAHGLESEPAESVAFLRDESANAVWAVESRVPDGLGGGQEGASLARRFRAALEAHERVLEAAANGDGTPPAPPDGNGAGEGEAPRLRYLLGTAVPENWIPFVPVHKPHETREIRLQRAAMPRFLLGRVEPVRPVTSVLRPGLGPDDAQQRPYFVNEEEVPRSGVVIDGAMQRARWTGGRTVVWHGRRRRAGRGEGGSGLRFDVVERAGGEGA